MIVLGRIVAPFGVRGWVKIQPFGDDPLAWRQMSQLWLGHEGHWRVVRLAQLEPHGKGLIGAFVGIDSRTAAELLCGMEIAAPRDALPATGEDEYYWADLVGLEVVNTQGRTLGRVDGLIAGGAHDVLSIRDEAGTQRLVPFVGAIVKEVDAAQGVIRVEWEADW